MQWILKTTAVAATFALIGLFTNVARADDGDRGGREGRSESKQGKPEWRKNRGDKDRSAFRHKDQRDHGDKDKAKGKEGGKDSCPVCRDKAKGKEGDKGRGHQARGEHGSRHGRPGGPDARHEFRRTSGGEAKGDGHHHRPGGPDDKQAGRHRHDGPDDKQAGRHRHDGPDDKQAGRHRHGGPESSRRDRAGDREEGPRREHRSASSDSRRNG